MVRSTPEEDSNERLNEITHRLNCVINHLEIINDLTIDKHQSTASWPDETYAMWECKEQIVDIKRAYELRGTCGNECVDVDEYPNETIGRLLDS